MTRFPFTTLRVQALLWTLLPLTIIILVVGSVGVYAYNEVVNRLVQDRDSELARLSADRLSENIVNHAAVLEVLGNALQSERFAQEQKLNGEQSRVFQTAVTQGLLHSFDGGVRLYNASGEELYSVQSVKTTVDARGNDVYVAAIENVGSSIANEEYFLGPESTLAPYFTNVIAEPRSRKPQILLAVAIADEAGEFTGLLTGGFLLENETLGSEIAKLNVGTAYLVDAQGRVIWHSDSESIGQDFSGQRAVQALLGKEASLPGAHTDGGVVEGYAQVDVSGWGLVIQESWEAVIGPVRTFQWMMLGTMLVGLALVMVIISSGTRRLTDPIKELVSQTQLLSHGDFVGHVEGGTVHEMRALSSAFNEMADRVARYRAGLQSYVGAITQSQEAERKRIARELHDDTIQSLIALGRRLELLEQSLENPIDAAKQLYQLQQMLTHTVAEVRQFSRDLRPLLLEDVGLVAAVRQMLREMERRDGVEASLRIEGEASGTELDDELEVAFYRIAQEALNNIRKHAQATRVEVTLRFEPEEVQLEVRDNGRGFPVAETDDLARRGSFGLMGIRERAKLFGGAFELESSQGDGTCVSVRLPHNVGTDYVLEELQAVGLAG